MDYIAFLTDLMQYIPVNQRLENFQYCVSVMARTLQDSRWTGRHGSLCAAMRFTIISTFRTSIRRKRRPCSTRCGHSQQNVPTSVCSRRDWCSRQSTANIPSCLPKKPYVRVKGRPKEAAEQALHLISVTILKNDRLCERCSHLLSASRNCLQSLS